MQSDSSAALSLYAQVSMQVFAAAPADVSCVRSLYSFPCCATPAADPLFPMTVMSTEHGCPPPGAVHVAVVPHDAALVWPPLHTFIDAVFCVLHWSPWPGSELPLHSIVPCEAWMTPPPKLVGENVRV